MAWAASCACHWDLKLDAEFRSSAGLARWRSCPFRGRRVPELPAGDFAKEFRSCLSTAASALSLQLSATLSEVDRLSILSEFEVGRSHLVFYVSYKRSYLEAPPWCIFAMAHHDPRVCTAC